MQGVGWGVRRDQWFRGGLVFKAHRLLYHSTLGLRFIKKKKTCTHHGHGRVGIDRGLSLEKYSEREFFIDSLLVRIYFINVMIRWSGLAP